MKVRWIKEKLCIVCIMVMDESTETEMARRLVVYMIE